MSDASSIDDTIVTAAGEVEAVSADGASVKNRSVDDLIKAREHTARADAAAKNHLGLHFRKMIPLD